MKVHYRKGVTVCSLLGFMLCCLNSYAMTNDCPPPITCAPCGEVIVNTPLPSPDACGVNPYQNYIATYESCIRPRANALYLGTGFGYGTIDYNLKIAGSLPINFTNFNNSYITEYVTLGYAHSTCRFFIAGELGYYYNSVTHPFFYEDTSSFILRTPVTPTELEPSITRVFPCTVRLDVNSQNRFAFDLLPGFLLTDRLTLFSRVGIEYTPYKWMRRFCFPQVIALMNIPILPGIITDVSVNDPFSGDINDEETDSVVDFRLGIGAAFAAGRHVSFTVNYVHVFGSQSTFTPNQELIAAAAPVVINTVTGLQVGILESNIETLSAKNSIDPTRNEILFGVIFSL